MRFGSPRSTRRLRTGAVLLALAWLEPVSAGAQVLDYANVTDRSGGPGQGRSPSINNSGDIAFWLLSGAASDIYFYDRSEGTFLNLLSLPGAPSEGWFPKINNLGNILFLEPATRDLWLFERRTRTLTNLASLSGYPGDTAAFGLASVFGINDQNQVSFHTGDRNVGDIYLYEHAAGRFLNLSDRSGAPGRGRENAINNGGRVAYMGFPDIYVYDIASDTTTRVDQPPGGLPGGSFALNDQGDIAFFRGGRVEFYDASDGSLLDLSTLPGYPPIAQPASGFENDLSDSGEVTFWQDMVGLFYFDPAARTFTRMTDQGIVPAFGMATSINDFGEIALAAGQDVFLAEVVGTAPRLRLQVNGVRPEPPVVRGPGTTLLTLDMKPGTFTRPLDWYYLIYVNATGQALWVTSRGLSATPAPIVSATRPLDLDSLTLLRSTFPAGTTLTFGFFLLDGATLVASDFIATVVSAP